MSDKLNQSLISRLKEGVKTKNLTKKEWAQELYPELEIWHALANINSLLSGARGRGNYIFAIPICYELILKDVTEKSEWFLVCIAAQCIDAINLGNARGPYFL